MSRHRPFCLSIAGHDPSAGAGLLADAKVFNYLKVQGLYVATCNTIQTEDEFERIEWVDRSFVLRQLEVILNKYQPKFIKVGLIENTTFLQEVLNNLAKHKNQFTVVWDPILAPTASNNMNTKRFQGSLTIPENVELFATPNRKEFEQFGESFFKKCAGLYIKNGDRQVKKGVDQLHFNHQVFTLNPRIKTELTKHGTGCTFSSAMTAYLALNYPKLKAAFRSKRLTEKLLMSTKTKLGHLY